MTRDEQLIKAALDMAAETAGAQMAPITGTPYAAGGRVFATAIRAIDPADVLAKVEVKTRRDLVKAGALILAEIERLDRAALAQKEGK